MNAASVNAAANPIARLISQIAPRLKKDRPINDAQPNKELPMPTLNWLKKEFDYGYDSGNVASLIPNRIRRSEESKIGGSYRKVFQRGIKPFLKPDSQVLELGPGRGAWSRSILNLIPQGRLQTVDFQDVRQWLSPQRYDQRLVCHQVTDNTFGCIENESIDFFWSMGVLCHNNQTHVREILTSAFEKLRPGAHSCHQFADWKKLNQYGWQRGGVPEEFQQMNDDEIWWPRNSTQDMVAIAESIGWEVVQKDLGLLRRDGLILLRKPQ